ncbi:pyridoxal phosphate-dependent aminotransferase [Minwuia thermotolerans]|uniref:aspartate transaminase n=1 Tax=Minwuia thermotolerans TaxID=2056226 RepID=A0A2M9G3W3_9PROT|nr:pyridoxal phosphate-dependent aminotransferase [Minwuia thermotolerans]PJK30390.1 aspartate aminotransferase [Minwuia thermotolerans]
MILAERMSHLGTETAFEVLARANALAAQGRSVINLGIGQPDFPTPANVVEAGRKALADGHHGYTPANGIPALREAVAADIHRRYGHDVDPDLIVCVPGGKVTMAFAMLIFGQPGTEILYPDPGFPIYRSMIQFSGAKAVPIRLYEKTGFSFSADEVLGQINERTRLIILNSPANPTGGVVPRAEIEKLVTGLEKHPDVAIMSDEIYSCMTYDGLDHVTLMDYPSIRDRLIVLDGWSKTYAMTGWRLGWGLWPKQLAPLAAKLAVNTHSCVNAATQYAGIEALQGPQDAVAEMVAAFDRRRKRIVERLNELTGVSCVTPKGAFYAFPNITATGLDSGTLQDRLLQETGVAAIAGTSFGVLGEGYLRFSYASSIENIEEAMDRIAGWLKANL